MANGLVSYVRPSRYEFVSMSGCARIVDDRARVRELWREGFKVQDGPLFDAVRPGDEVVFSASEINGV